VNYNFELDIDSRNSLSLILKRMKPDSSVLEFGTANGRMSKYLKEQMNCKVYGVEIDAMAAKDAARYTEKMLVENVEEYNWKKELNSMEFDYIVFADILEHLYDPKKMLLEVKSFLKDGGSVLVSIPNVAHNAIIINLLKNQFNYSETGLLDNTHIKFYTKKTFDELIKSCGYFTSYETAVYMKPNDTEFDNSYGDLPEEVGDYLSTLPCGELYQLVFELKKNELDKISDFSDKYKNFGTSYIQLFVDVGNGFNEKESIRIAYNNQSTVSFDLTRYPKIKQLRFDPIDNYLFLKLKSITIDGERSTDKITSSAFYVDNNTYLFDDNDPQMYLNFSYDKKINNISFDVEYLLIGEETSKEIKNKRKQLIVEKDDLLVKKEKMLQEQNLFIENLQKTIADKNFEIWQLNDLITHLNAVAQSMRIKNRIKKLLPSHLKNILKKVFFKYRFISNKYVKFRLLSKANGTLFVLKQLVKSKLYKSKALSFKKTNINLQSVQTVKDKISIVIPTYNGLSDLVKLIPQLINQKGFKNIEIVIIDSSSSDGTKDFIQKFSSVKFITIEQKDFSHSYARNLGYENCTGEYVLFLVQDALPDSDMWLYSFYKLLINNNLSALSCVQIVNAEADFYTCYGIDSFNKFLGLSGKNTKITKKYIEGTNFSRQLAQLDNVACMFKSFEFEKYKFAGRYAEDLEIGLRMVKNNERIGITSEVSVIHSHLRSPYYYMKRALVETDVLNEMFKEKVNENIILEDELSDIYGTFYLVGILISKLETLSKFPINFESFNQYIVENLENTIAKEFDKNEFELAYKTISKYDNEFAQTIKIFHDNDIKIQKGALFCSVDHLVKEGVGYMEQKFTNIDKKIFAEFCFFIIKIFATNAGVKIGTNKALCEKSDNFMSQLIQILQKGV